MKQLISLLCSVLLLIVAVPLVVTADSALIEVYTVEDLYNVRNDLSGHYVLMADLDLSDSTAVGGAYDHNGCGWFPIGANEDYTATEFTGVFDGNGHSIVGLRVDLCAADSLPSKICVGLFGSVSGTVKDLTVDGSVSKSVTSRRSYAGGIVGYATGVIENCINKASVYNTGANSHAGGIAGYVWNGEIRCCRNDGAVAAEYTDKDYYSYAGGIVGYAQSSVIRDCYNTGTVRCKDDSQNTFYAGGITANIFASQIETCYNIGTVERSKRLTGISAITDGTISSSYCLEGNGNAVTGVTALTKEQMRLSGSYVGFDFDTVWQMGEGEYPYPILRSMQTLLGDIDNNGVIDMSDAFALYAAASTGTITPAVNRYGDMNGDGDWNMIDAFALYRTASGE